MASRVALFYGTRPELIKVIPIIKAFSASNIDLILIYTNQHGTSLNGIISDYGIENSLTFDINREDSSLENLISSVYNCSIDFLNDGNVDAVMVHGDTASAYAVALASFLLKIPLFHIEAGLRTYNMNEPFPEEFFRRSIDSMSRLLFAPTKNNYLNLIKEGIEANTIFITGNTIVDLLLQNISDKEYTSINNDIQKRKALITIHRRENIPRLDLILKGIKDAVIKLGPILFILPLHVNPAVRNKVIQELSGLVNVELVEPIDVRKFHLLLNEVDFVVTDSGGIQEESVSLGIPTLVLRKATERNEALLGQNIKLVEFNSEIITNSIVDIAEISIHRRRVPEGTFGDGKSSNRILNLVENYFAIMNEG